jgi:hypothetical protein
VVASVLVSCKKDSHDAEKRVTIKESLGERKSLSAVLENVANVNYAESCPCKTLPV